MIVRFPGAGKLDLIEESYGARTVLQAGARAGDRDAAYRLAMCHRLGIGGEADEASAAAWLWAAARAGHAEAQLVLGLCCYEGSGAERDLGQATDWFRRAALQGHVRAQHWLARCCFYGEGCVADAAESYYWCLAAKANGFPGSAGFTMEVARRLSVTERGRIEAEFLPSNIGTAALLR